MIRACTEVATLYIQVRSALRFGERVYDVVILSMTIPRKMVALAALLLSILPSPAMAACVLQFGWTSWQPYHYASPNGGMAGIDYELVTEAVRRMGCTIVWKEMPRNRAMTLVREGRLDGVAGVTLTEERQGYARFSRHLRLGRNILLVRRGYGDSLTFRTLDGLADSSFRLGVVPGAQYSQTYERLLAEGRLDDNNIQVSTLDGAVTMLVRGRIDGFITGELVARQLVAEMGVDDQVEVHPTPIENATAYVMFSRRSVAPDIVERFNAALDTMDADGTSDRLQGNEAPGGTNGGLLEEEHASKILASVMVGSGGGIVTSADPAK